ncbi:PREDICTED: DNA-directed RNA polymerase [Prunus dulcis]|uniref:PREDICTED: DNA-directed RNA polymerase n=1 Tax=Prunus dulcis TaxID=3755 RepID=A0A5E4FAA6_PRUDU|nr:PREDICTED: DNA-directed RNA polymerase [Prunus dulcis]
MLDNRELHFLRILYTHLTGSHMMMMIALACRDAGLRFVDIGTYTLLKCSVLRGLEGIDSSKQSLF